LTSNSGVNVGSDLEICASPDVDPTSGAVNIGNLPLSSPLRTFTAYIAVNVRTDPGKPATPDVVGTAGVTGNTLPH
jgi:hypothetical protein